jgi:hypothetical protein
VHHVVEDGDQPGGGQVGPERAGTPAAPHQPLHPLQRRGVVRADPFDGQLALRGEQQGPEPVDDAPGGRDQAGQRGGRLAGEVDGLQRLLGLRDGTGERRVDQVGTRAEVPVQRDPPDAGRLRDLGDAGRRVPRQALRGRVQDRLHVAPRVRAPPRRLGCDPHPSNPLSGTPVYELPLPEAQLVHACST